MDRSATVGVIGIGMMGAGVARRLLAQGMQVAVRDRDAARTAALAAEGASVATTPADVMACDTVLILVATEAQVRAVVDEIAAAAGPAAALRRVAVMSTVAPQTLTDVAALLNPLGIRVVDAPISGGVPRVLAGQLTIMAAGAAADIAGFDPVFSRLGNNVFHCGGLGAGQVAKVVNNVLCHASTSLVAEAMRMGIAQGLTPQTMAQVMEVSTGRTYLSANPDGVAQTYARHSRDRETFDGLLAIIRKDLAIAAAMARDCGIRAPLTESLAHRFTEMGDETFENWCAMARAGTPAPTAG